MLCCRRIQRGDCTIKHAEHAFATSIRGLKQHRPISARRIARPQDIKVGREFDETRGIPGSLFQICDISVGVEFGIDRKMRSAMQAFVCAGFSECSTIQNVAPRMNVNAH